MRAACCLLAGLARTLGDLEKSDQAVQWREGYWERSLRRSSAAAFSMKFTAAFRLGR